MRRFQFRLERFLDIRRWKEREWEIRLAHATGKVIVLKNRIAEIGTEIGASYERSFTSAGAVDVDAMAGRELYVQRLAAERTRRTAELAVRQRELEEVCARYLEAARDRKVLDKLKDRRAAEYYERARDEEYKSVDDLNTAREPLGGREQG
jgi:flagellar protein FliJ